MTACACGGPIFRGVLCAECMDRLGVVKVITNEATGAVTMLDRHGRDVLAVPAPAPKPAVSEPARWAVFHGDKYFDNYATEQEARRNCGYTYSRVVRWYAEPVGATPDELTVDDVLAFAGEAVQIRDVWMDKCTIGRWGNDDAGPFGLWFPSEPAIPGPPSDAPDFTGTLREVLTEAKRRGMLG